jgi:hypothetical protein
MKKDSFLSIKKTRKSGILAEKHKAIQHKTLVFSTLRLDKNFAIPKFLFHKNLYTRFSEDKNSVSFLIQT